MNYIFDSNHWQSFSPLLLSSPPPPPLHVCLTPKEKSRWLEFHADTYIVQAEHRKAFIFTLRLAFKWYIKITCIFNFAALDAFEMKDNVWKWVISSRVEGASEEELFFAHFSLSLRSVRNVRKWRSEKIKIFHVYVFLMAHGRASSGCFSFSLFFSPSSPRRNWKFMLAEPRERSSESHRNWIFFCRKWIVCWPRFFSWFHY